jgi:hypothetical protein
VRRLWWGWVTVVIVALPGCGEDGSGAEPVEAAEWAAVVCAEVGAAAVDLAEALDVINQLPGQVDADAPLGEQAEPLREAFLALPDYVDRFRAVVEATPAPATPDGTKFRDELLAELEEAATTFEEVADLADDLDDGTTVEQFFSGAQAFGDFPVALAASDLDFGEEVPPALGRAQADDDTCLDAQNQLVAILG